MGDVADLAGAMRFVMPIAVMVSHHLRAQDEDRQNQRQGQQAGC